MRDLTDLIDRLRNPVWKVPESVLDVPATLATMAEAAAMLAPRTALDHMGIIASIEAYAWERLEAFAEEPAGNYPEHAWLDVATRCRTLRMSIEIEQRRRAVGDVDAERG